MSKNKVVFINAIKFVQDDLLESSSSSSSDEEYTRALNRETRHRVKDFIRDVVQKKK